MGSSTSSSTQVVFQFGPFFRAYKDGRIERFFGTDFVPPSTDSPTGVSTKDVLISPETGVSARIFVPATIGPGQKLPLLVYYHGGGFMVGSPFCPTYHNHITSLVSQANIIAVSIDYRLAPEHPIPTAYQDSWLALQWVASHHDSNGEGQEAWLREHGDFQRVFLGGDSGGGNIVHNMALQASVEGLGGSVELLGVCLVHPYFGRKDGDGVDGYWAFVSPATSGSGDRRINPAGDSRLGSMKCRRVLVFVAEKDNLRERGLFYFEALGRSGWEGEMEIFETEGEEHVFYLFNPNCDKAKILMKRDARIDN